MKHRILTELAWLCISIALGGVTALLVIAAFWGRWP
jgi:hypothetical protein